MSYNGKIVDVSKYELKKEVELSKMEVQLATVADSENARKALVKTMGTVADKAVLVDKAMSNLRTAIKEAEVQSTEVTKIKNQLTAQVKELGLNPKDVPSIKDIESDSKFAKDNLARIKGNYGIK